MQVLYAFDRFLTFSHIFTRHLRHCTPRPKKGNLAVEGPAHDLHHFRLLTNVPNIKEALQLRMHTCAHMHAHLAFLMLAVVTAFCEETRRGRSKFTLVLHIGVLVR